MSDKAQPSKTNDEQTTAKGKDNRLSSEMISLSVTLLLIVALPIGLIKYDYSLSRRNPGKVFHLIARNLPGEEGLWIAHEAPGWDYARHHHLTSNEIRVKQGELLTLRLSSIDVVHGFSLPEYGIKEKVYPGKVTTVTFTADKSGQFKYECFLFCRDGHEDMVGKLIVESPRRAGGGDINE
jgi:cytochrome c oxidase subunit 2